MAKNRPALLLTGCRQSGKTSLLKKLFPDYSYVTLDIPLLAEQAESSGIEFLESREEPLIIDEVQYAPELLRYIKIKIDEDREKMGRFHLTGSQKFSLMEGVTESLAGRITLLDLLSLSSYELEKWIEKPIEGDLLVEMILKGGYPELHARGLEPEQFYSDYLATYLERDVRQLVNVKNLRDFDRFIRLLALRSGQLLSMNSLASDVGVSVHTIKSWISILEISNIIYLLEPYYKNLGKRLVRAPKIYFLDTGLLVYLLGIRTRDELKNSALIGSIFETHTLGQLLRGFYNYGKKPDLFFYRDHHGHEIDFVIPVGEKLKLIECKWSQKPSLPHKTFAQMEKLIGGENILSRDLITPARGVFTLKYNTRQCDSIDVTPILEI